MSCGEFLPFGVKAAETLRKIGHGLIIDHFPSELSLPLRDLRWFFLKLVGAVNSIISFISAPGQLISANNNFLHEANLVRVWNGVGSLMDSVFDHMLTFVMSQS